METQLLQKKADLPTQFLAQYLLLPNGWMDWMKTPLGTEVDLGPGHIVLDGDPAASRKGHGSPRSPSAHVYCFHGRPSQLLLSSCNNLYPRDAMAIASVARVQIISIGSF